MLPEEKKALIEQVDVALNDVRPHLKVDGGDVEVVDITDDFEVSIRWLGNCQNCAMSMMTLKAGIEQAVLTRVPIIKRVVASNGLMV